MAITFPKELLEALNLEVNEKSEEQENIENTAFKNGTYTIISKMAYLTGVKKEIFDSEKHSPKPEIYREMETDKNARIIRNLCMLRNALERHYTDINIAMKYDIKNLNTLPELIPQESIKSLLKDGISIIKANTSPSQYIININRLINDRINNCKSIFPIWLNWDYIKSLFIMPNGLCEDGIRKAATEYYGNYQAYPYQIYINWGYYNAGNIFYNDKKFVTILYEKNKDSFFDMSKVTDAGARTKDDIYRFLEESDKVCVMVDCENSDPYKLYATLKNLDQEKLINKINKIILYDDIHTTNAWKILGEFTSIPTEHILIDRVKEDKSLVDIKLSTGTCKEFYQNNISSFVIVSSDSDYWGLITSLPEAKFLTMVEWEKCGPDIKKALEDRGFTYCYIDDFCTGNTDEIKVSAVLNEVKTRLFEAVNFNIRSLLEDSYFETRAEISENEKKQIYEKYIKKMQLKITDDGQVTVELARA